MKYEIKANKRRSFLMFSLSILFVVLGFLPFLGVGLREYRKYLPVSHDVIFIVVIIFFGFTALIYLKMMKKKNKFLLNRMKRIKKLVHLLLEVRNYSAIMLLIILLS